MNSKPVANAGPDQSGSVGTTITLDGSLTDQLVRDLIEDSYDLVVSALPKRTREQLGWQPAGEPGATG